MIDDISRTIRVGLVWHSMNSGNLGVGALSLTNIAIVEKLAREAGLTPQFVVIGWTDKREPYLTREDVEVVQLRLKDFVKPVGGLFSTLRSCDLVLDIGAGDSFADIYGRQRIITQLASKFLTILAGRPLILCPQTIGPFTDRAWRRLALWTIRRAAGVATRDDASTAFLREMGYDGDVIEATDVALRLPYTRPETRSDGPVKVGINISGLLYSGGYTRDNMFGLVSDYPTLMARIVEYFTSQDGVEIHLVSHVLPDEITTEDAGDYFAAEDDHLAALKVKEQFPDVVISPVFADPMQAKSYIAGLDFFMGARMHACIAAFSSGVPVVPMAYSRKFAGLFGTLGYDKTVDCVSDTADTIFEAVVDGFQNRDALKVEMDKAFARGEGRLGEYDAALRSAFDRFQASA
ncbi:MAG: polysaccharide pyruvyl transferase family protein [Pseudomonadota bacterium]